MKILVYVRKWTRDFYLKLLHTAFENPDITVISDFRGLGDIWSGTYLYDIQYDERNEDYEKEKKDITARCRFLRSISEQKAEELGRRFWNGVEEVISEGRFDFVCMPIIDCYTMDIIERIAEKHNIIHFSPVTSFVSGYSRYTKRGEFYPAERPVTDEEIKAVLDKLLKDDYTVTFAANRKRSVWDTKKFYIRRRLVDAVYFPYRSRKEKDRWNYHYNTRSFTEGPYRNYDVKKAEKYYKKLSQVRFSAADVYIPLHFTPEATVDYWCDDARWAQYNDSIVDFIQKSDSNIHFIVKEHPAVYGRRNIAFYEQLCALSNVDIVHPYENSNMLLAKVQNVLVYTGSVGVEALLRGKKVFSVTDNYYYGTSPNIVRTERLSVSDLTDRALETDNDAMMRKLLSGMFIGVSSANADINASDLDAMAAEMRRIYDLETSRGFRNL